MNDPRYRPLIVSSARRHLTEDLREAVAAAAFGFMRPLAREPTTRREAGSAHLWRTGTARDAAPTESCTASTIRTER